MRFLADENVPSTAIVRLRDQGMDIVSVREVTSGASDEAVIAAASANRRVVLTLDKDFGERVFPRGEQVPGLILFRKTRAMRRLSLSDWIVQVVVSRSDWEGAFSTVTDDARIRMRPLRSHGPEGQNH